MLDYRIFTFLTLCDKMNYRKTAQAMNITQPGVTQHIQHLENHYGVKLFTYDGKRLKMTPQAELLKKHVSEVLAGERDLRQKFSGAEKLHLEVGATKTIGEYVLPAVLHAFLQKPGHSINFVIDNTEKLLSMLENAELDFAVIEGIFDKTRYGHQLYKKEDYVGICAQNHSFAGRRVTLTEVFKETLVIRERGSGTRRLLEQAICDKGFSLDCFSRCLSISNFSVIMDVVAKEGAITFAYAPVAAQRTDLSVFEVEDMQITGEFNFVYCNERTAAEKIRQFWGKESCVKSR